MDILLSAASITMGAAVTVALWTFRIALANRGRRALGPSGPATTVFVAVDDRRVADLLALADSLEPRPSVSVGRLRETRAVPLPAGFVQVGQRSWTNRGTSRHAAAEPTGPDPDIGIRDLRLASAELGEALAAATGVTDSIARAIAGWLVEVGAGLGRELVGLAPTPVLLARAHGGVGRALLSAAYVPDAAALAARARGLADALRRVEQGG